MDYILTGVGVGVYGVRPITTTFPGTYDYRVLMAITTVFILNRINLRGVRESGTIFALPTYAFVGRCFAGGGIGLVRFTGLFGAPDLVGSAGS
ncbi:MAG: hypothetical protein IPK53_03385 [bacterium]|nr:hypothetical protein [bacterium]